MTEKQVEKQQIASQDKTRLLYARVAMLVKELPSSKKVILLNAPKI